jgi:alcohol dehydrogenase
VNKVAMSRALVLEGPKRLVLRDIPLPELEDSDGIIRVEACGLCGTDHEQYSGALGAGFAFVPGHEAVGTVEAIGPLASERLGVVVGDRVAVEVFQSCRACPACLAGEYRRCSAHGIGDMYGFIPLDKPPGLWGGYAEHLYLSADAIVHRVPPSLDPVVATVFNPLGAGIRWGVTLPETKAGDVVAVLGPGIRGLSVCAAAAGAGAGFVALTGLGSRDTERLEVAKSFGADLAVDVEKSDPVEELRRAAGCLADIVVDVTAKAPAALGQAVQLCRPGGTVVLAGTRASTETPGFEPDHVVYKELRILGALGVDSASYAAALDMLAARRWPFAELRRRVVGLDEAASLLDEMAGDRPPVHGVIVP